MFTKGIDQLRCTDYPRQCGRSADASKLHRRKFVFEHLAVVGVYVRQNSEIIVRSNRLASVVYLKSWTTADPAAKRSKPPTTAHAKSSAQHLAAYAARSGARSLYPPTGIIHRIAPPLLPLGRGLRRWLPHTLVSMVDLSPRKAGLKRRLAAPRPPILLRG